MSHKAVAIASIPDTLKKMEIEARCNRIIASWQEQCDLAIRLAREDLKEKSNLAKALRDAELREIEKEPPSNEER